MTAEISPAALLARARWGIVAGLAAFAVATWAYLFLVAARMEDMSSVFAMPMTSAWTPTQAGLMLVMWAVMMASMMLPSAAPMVVAYDRLDRASAAADRAGGSTRLFVAGYLAVWAIFGVGASGLQWLLHDRAVVDAMGVAMSPMVAGTMLLAAGIFQFTPLKDVCLGKCRSPMGFLMTSWREGRGGAFVMGLHHGGYCVGCCWALMALLFVIGIMNLAWVSVLAGFVLVEKVAPGHLPVSRLGGAVLAVWGLVVLL